MIVCQIIFTALAVLIHYNILTVCLILLTGYSFIKHKGDSKAVICKVISFCLAIVFLVGMPMGVIEIWYPNQANSENVVKGVTVWMNQ
jgi:hypothetical protein